MNKRQFIRQREKSWKRFETLVNRLDRAALVKLSAREIAEYSRLFRELANDLATIRSRGWGEDLASYLNHLVSRAHNSFYRAPGSLARIVRYVTTGFPRLFRANIGYFLLACVLFFVSGGISWGLIQNDPSLATRVIDSETLDLMNEMYSAQQQAEAGGETEPRRWGGFGEERAAMAGFYVYNNVGIALRCFAIGIVTLGVGSAYMLLFNGIYIGAIGGYICSQGNADRFLSFVISHGSFELTAIAVAGGAGLMLGDAVIHRGQRTFAESLKVRSWEAVQIAAGAAVMLFIAAGIEAFWSPSPIPAILKYVVGSALWLTVAGYLALAGRGT